MTLNYNSVMFFVVLKAQKNDVIPPQGKNPTQITPISVITPRHCPQPCQTERQRLSRAVMHYLTPQTASGVHSLKKRASPAECNHSHPQQHPFPDNSFPNDAWHHYLSPFWPTSPCLEGTLPQFHTHPSDAYEIATLFLFFSFFYRRINSAPFSIRSRNTPHHPKKWRGRENGTCPVFHVKKHEKKSRFSTPPFLLHPKKRSKFAQKSDLSTGRRCRYCSRSQV